MNELSLISACVTNVAKLLPSLAAAASHKNYPHHVFFLQSVCKQVAFGSTEHLFNLTTSFYVDPRAT